MCNVNILMEVRVIMIMVSMFLYCITCRCSVITVNTVQYPFKVPQFKVFSHLRFTFNDLKSVTLLLKFPSFKVSLALVFKHLLYCSAEET
jgi:hypothetical protein